MLAKYMAFPLKVMAYKLLYIFWSFLTYISNNISSQLDVTLRYPLLVQLIFLCCCVIVYFIEELLSTDEDEPYTELWRIKSNQSEDFEKDYQVSDHESVEETKEEHSERENTLKHSFRIPLSKGLPDSPPNEEDKVDEPLNKNASPKISILSQNSNLGQENINQDNQSGTISINSRHSENIFKFTFSKPKGKNKSAQPNLKASTWNKLCQNSLHKSFRSISDQEEACILTEEGKHPQHCLQKPMLMVG